MELGQQIKAHLKRIGMTQQELAAISDTEESQLSEWFSGKKKQGVTESTLVRVMAALNANPLTFGKVEGYPKQRPKRVPPVRKAKPKK